MAASMNSSGAGEHAEERTAGESGTIGEDAPNAEAPEQLAFVAPGADNSEPVRFAAEIARRPDEVIFLTRTAELAEALRGWGLLAAARPKNGRWCEAACEAIEDRDVVFLETVSDGGDDWSRADARDIRRPRPARRRTADASGIPGGAAARR